MFSFVSSLHISRFLPVSSAAIVTLLVHSMSRDCMTFAAPTAPKFKIISESTGRHVNKTKTGTIVVGVDRYF